MKAAKFAGSATAMWIRRFAEGWFAMWILVLAVRAQVPSYTIMDLGTNGGTGASARNLNDQGQVVGQSATAGGAQHAFLWQDSVMTDPGVLPPATDSDARGIDPAGAAGGLSGSFPVVYRDGGVLKMPASGVNDTGVVNALNTKISVGYVNALITTVIVGPRAVKWQDNIATELAPTVFMQSQATDINAADQIAGWQVPLGGNQHAMIWSGATATDLHGAWAVKTRSLGYAINGPGAVVGVAFNTSIALDGIPFQVPAGGSIAALPLPAGTPRGQAFDINNAGDVVGVIDPGTVAAIWPGGATAIPLQDLIPTGTGWALKVAYSINNRGEIAGYGIKAGQTRAFLLRPTGYHPCAGLKTELIDPATPDPEPNPGYHLLTDRDITMDQAKLAVWGAPAVGLVADGTTRLVLRCTCGEPGTVTVGFPGAGEDVPAATGVAAQDGWLGRPGAKPSADSMTLTTSPVAGKHQACAVYLAPEEFPASLNSVSTRVLFLKVRFDGPAGCDPLIRYVAVRVDRPPVVTMHGLWSNWYDAFNGFRVGVKAQISGLRILGPDYPNAAHFSENKTFVPNQIEWFRGELRKERMAMVQADVFGHSMGGLLGRQWAAEPGSHNRTNYGEGDINRLVTIDSPHCGSPIADAVWLYRASVSQIIRDDFDFYLEKLGKSVDRGAIEDLRVFGTAISDLTGKYTDARSHAIAGDFTIPVDLCDPLQTGPLAPFFCALDCAGIAVSGNLPTHCDLIVGLDSQFGGLVSPTTDKHDHQHSGAANQSAVIADSVGLLRTRPSSPFFADGFPFGCPTAPPIIPATPRGVRSTGGVLISDPPEGASVVPGGTVAVQCTADPGGDLTSVDIFLAGATARVNSAPFEVTLTVPSGAFGTIDLLVTGSHADGTISRTSRTLTATPSQSLLSLSAEPAAIGIFHRPHRERARITGTFSGGATRNLTASATGTTYLSSDTSVAAADAEGWLTPVANGTATVTASNGSRSTGIAVTVSLTPECDLSLSSPVSVLGLMEGESAVVSFTAGNNGPDMARPVDVFVTATAAVTVEPGAAAGGAWTPGPPAAWSMATLAASGSAAPSLTVRAVAPGAGILTASIAGTGLDFVSENNAVSIPVRVFANPRMRFATGGGEIRFSTEAGVTFNLETSSTIAPGSWSVMATIPGDGTEQIVPIPPGADPRRFYQLRLTDP